MRGIFSKVKKSIKQEDIRELNDSELILFFNRKIIDFCSKSNLEIEIPEVMKISKMLKNEFRGFGIIDEFLEDDFINEIMINSYNVIFLEKSGEIVMSEITFDDVETYQRIIQKIVSEAGREVNTSNPIVDARMYEGSRVNIVLPPISKDSPVVTIRKFPKSRIDIKKLIEMNTISKKTSEFLKVLVKSKYNILIGGGTSSGKTTFLNAMSEYIDDFERIITIEDSRELNLIGKKNLVSLETRNPNNSNKGEIDIKLLIKNSLRMRPDRIIVGEVRSDETLDMLQAMNTGHEGSLSTVHANSCEDMISRVETMVLRSSQKIPLEAVQKMISSSLEILIYLKKVGEKERKIVEISELYFDNNQVKINNLYKYDYNKRELVRTSNKFINRDKMERYYLINEKQEIN